MLLSIWTLIESPGWAGEMPSCEHLLSSCSCFRWLCETKPRKDEWSKLQYVSKLHTLQCPTGYTCIISISWFLTSTTWFFISTARLFILHPTRRSIPSIRSLITHTVRQPSMTSLFWVFEVNMIFAFPKKTVLGDRWFDTSGICVQYSLKLNNFG